MIVTELLGGLGNQLFQYAAGRALSEKLGKELYLGVDHFKNYTLRKYELSPYSIQEKFMTKEMISNFNLKFQFKEKNLFEKVLHRIVPTQSKPEWRVIKEKENFIFDESLFKVAEKNIYLSGYWQSPRYFENIQKELRTEFKVKKDPTERNKEIINLLQTKKAVSVHVRRGDYITNPSATNFHGLCSPEYYFDSVQKMIEAIGPDLFIIFSDDIDWCKINMKFPLKTLYSDHNSPDMGQEDIRLMQFCRGHVIANSSFSWWGAWLANDRSEKVIAPKYWTSRLLSADIDVLPKNWIVSSY